MDNITLGQFITFVSLVSAFVLALKNITKPISDFNAKIKELEKKVEALEKAKADDYERLKSYDKDIHLMLKVCYNLLEHEVTGNHTQDMTNTLNELRSYMLNK